VVALRIAKAKKSHTIAETPVKSCPIMLKQFLTTELATR